MNLVRFTCLLSVTLAVLLAVGGQTWALDLAETDQSDPTVTVWDDSLVADCVSPHAGPGVAPNVPVMFDFSPPSDRLVISELFRPPRHAPAV